VETAQKLAETEQARAEAERQRAEEEARSAGRFKRLAAILAGVVVIAIALAGAAVSFGQQASRNEAEAQANLALASESGALAATREAEALAEAEQRALAQAKAEREAAISFSRELSAAALGDLADDPERSILLALQAMAVTYTVAAENALHEAVLSSRIRGRLDIPGPGREYYLDLSPDGRYLFSSGEHGALLWDVESGNLLYERDIDGWINQSQFTLDGKRLITANEEHSKPEEGSVTVLDVESGEEIFTFVAHDSGVRYLVLSSDGRLLVTGSANGVVRIWDWPLTLAAGRGELLRTMHTDRGSIWGLAFSPDGMQLAAASHDGTATVWNSGTGQELHLLGEDLTQILLRVTFSPDGQHLLAVGSEGTIDIWDLISGQRVSSTSAHANIDDVDFDSSGNLLVTAGGDAKAKLWRYSAGFLQEIMTLAGHGARLRAAEFSSDGSRLITSSADGTIRYWDVSPHGSEELFTLMGHEGSINDIDTNYDGSRLVSGGQDGSAIVWDASTGLELFSLVGHEVAVRGVDFSPDGRTIATASEDMTIKLWNAGTGQLLDTFSGHGEGIIGNLIQGVVDVEFSPDGNRLATAGADGMAKVWDVASGRELLSIAGHPKGYGLTEVAFSPDGHLLATGSDDLQDDGLVKVWDAFTGEELFTVGEGRIRIWSVTFSPEGDRLSIADRNGIVDVWLLPGREEDSENERAEPEQLFCIPVHSSTARGLRFSADGGQIVTAGLDGKVSFLDSWTGEPLLTIDRPSGYFGTALAPAGDWLALAGTDGRVYVYALDLELLTSLAQSQVTRSLTTAECQQYLHMGDCPGN
jgi:WD40 repeat protein